MQTITITTILQKMRDFLLADAAIEAWAQTKYGRKPVLYVGVDLKKMPKEDTVPHIILLPDGKDEGLEQGTHVYQVIVAWCVRDTSVTTGAQSVEYEGLYNSDALGQLIWECLSNLSSNCPASRCEYDVEGSAMAPLFPGYMTIEIRVPVVMGATITL